MKRSMSRSPYTLSFLLPLLLCLGSPRSSTFATDFIRGDSNGDRDIDLSDAVFTLAYLFLGGSAPSCDDAADVDDSGKIDLSDAVYTLAFLFQGDSAPKAPHPTLGCDPSLDSLSCDSGCGLQPPYRLTCRRTGPVVDLDWQNGDVYDEIQVRRDGALLATLRGNAVTYQDRREGCSGASHYDVQGKVAENLSQAATCTVEDPLGGVPPSIEVIEPTPGKILGTTTARVRVKVTDDGTITKVLIDGEDALSTPPAAVVTVNRDVTLKPGQNLIHIVAIDDTQRASATEVAVGVNPLVPAGTRNLGLLWALRSPDGFRTFEDIVKTGLTDWDLEALIDEAGDEFKKEQGIPVIPDLTFYGEGACMGGYNLSFEAPSQPGKAIEASVNIQDIQVHGRYEGGGIFIRDSDWSFSADELVVKCFLNLALKADGRGFDWTWTECQALLRGDLVIVSELTSNPTVGPALQALFSDQIREKVAEKVGPEVEKHVQKTLEGALQGLLESSHTENGVTLTTQLTEALASEDGLITYMDVEAAASARSAAYPKYPGTLGPVPPSTLTPLEGEAGHPIDVAACVSLSSLHQALDAFLATGASRRLVDLPPIGGRTLTVNDLSQLFLAPFGCLPGVSATTPIQARIELRQTPSIALESGDGSIVPASLQFAELTLTLVAGTTDLVAFSAPGESRCQLKVDGDSLVLELLESSAVDPGKVQVVDQPFELKGALVIGFIVDLIQALSQDLLKTVGTIESVKVPLPQLTLDLNGDGTSDASFEVKAASLTAVDVDGGPSDWLCAALDLDWSWLPSAHDPGMDFNGDGKSDLAIGVPGEDLSGVVIPHIDAGSINVLYGSDVGLRVTGSQTWNKDSEGIKGASGTLDRFGQSLAGGDFDGDGYMDLAVGVPGESHCDDASAGAVHVLYGSQDGLQNRDQVFHQDALGLSGAAEEDDDFGSSVVTGDFNGDGYFDLAIGVPYEDVDGHSDAGMVNVLYGSPMGLVGQGSQGWYQGKLTIKGAPEANDLFGLALTAGDFDHDSHWDLAIGAPGENASAGVVHVLYGSESGLTPERNQLWDQDNSQTSGSAEEGDQFGYTLAAGDFDDDGFADLAIGSPMEDVGDETNAGLVTVIRGSAGGLSEERSQTWHQDSEGVPGVAEGGDHFGLSLAVGNFDGKTGDDLAVGVPGENLDGIHIGAVYVFYGSSGGLTTDGVEYWDLNQDGMPVPRGAFIDFGDSLAAGDFNGDGRDDLAIGNPGNGTLSGPGVIGQPGGFVIVLRGSSGGLTTSNSQLWSQDVPGIGGSAEDCDRFGAALSGSAGAGSRDVSGSCH